MIISSISYISVYYTHMTNVPVKEYMIHNLQLEYKKYSSILINLQKHIEYCNSYGVISVADKNNHYKMINDVLKQLNATFNDMMIKICEETKLSDEADKVSSFPLISSLCSITDKGEYTKDNIRDLVNCYKIINNNGTGNGTGTSSIIIKCNNEFNDPFSCSRAKILQKIAPKVGLKSIDDALTLYIGENYTDMYDKDTLYMINFYNELFVPLCYEIKLIPKEIVPKDSKDTYNNDMIFILSLDNLSDVLVNNCVTIHIRHTDENNDFVYSVFKGYFIHDPLNVTTRTAQICNTFIYDKKKSIENYIDVHSNLKDKDNNFLINYMRNAPLADILALKEEQFLNMIEEEYLKYTKLSQLNFINIMKEFISDGQNSKLSIKHMFQMLKLLLLSDKNNNVAGILFGIAKEKKLGTDYFISDVIYRNLNYASQIKLKKSSVSIKKELEKIKSLSIDDVDLKKQVAVSNNMPNNAKKAAIEKIDEMKSSNNEYYKQLLYVKTLINYPWPSPNDDTFFLNIGKTKKESMSFLDSVVSKLDEKVYGHKECKDSIRELIGKWISKPSSSGSSIGLVGPPGVGKTLIAKAIGQALGIPFVQITLGGQNDGEILHGHGYTYSGAQPGMVVKKMVEAGSARCIMYFDELDKAAKKNDNNEITSILIHLTDTNTNNDFQDRFFQEVNFPLNKVLFIFSYNDPDKIDHILLDRIKNIDVKPFKLQDKVSIVNKFVINEMSEMISMDPKLISISDEDIEFIIDQYTNEPGVRDLKRRFEKIFLKLNIDKIYGTNMFKGNKKTTTKDIKIKIDRELISTYLGKQNIHIQKVHEEDIVGVINGLYATDGGSGGVLPIQVYNNYTGSDEKFTLKLTGSQRRVMRESVLSAFTTAMHQVREDIRAKFVVDNPNGFHIHTPSGAVPKDGPSAGCAFATAFVSRILNKKIRHDIAMTGEIELTGKVTKIGGLQYKLNGAKKAGVKLVLVSKENAEDVDSIKKEYIDIFEDGFEVKLVENLSDVLAYALVDFDKTELV